MNHSSNEEQEFESLLAAVSERELTSWEHERFWKLLQQDPERIERWKEQCRLLGQLASLDPALLGANDISVPPGNVVSLPTSRRLPATSKTPARSRRGIFIAGAAALFALLATAAVLLLPSGDSGSQKSNLVETAPGPIPESHAPELERDTESGRKDDPAPDDIPARTSPDSSTPMTEDALAEYVRRVASLPKSASQARPPTGFENISLPAGDGSTVDFNNDIRPILADKCFHCHGPDEHSRKADLRLDTEEGAFADLGGYSPFVPGDPGKSEAILRIFEEDPDSIMPPPEFHKEFTPEEMALMVRWVEQGAEWDQHWSFETPALTEAPDAGDWGHNAIDGFVLAAMREKGLEPNPEADRYTLARRAALDIIGLPPTPEQLEEFLDDESPDAYERYVDRLLASVHYGEHRARFWLDAARYGDTHGMHLDNYREMWPYRDWVIDAFNENMPFDRFATEQLAGDLLGDPTPDQLIATGFNRNHITTSEGGSIPEELAARYMVDRTETVSTIFLGLTTGCAACHDHKYDPISQKEFYSLAAFFGNTEDPAMDGNARNHFPAITVPDDKHADEWTALMEERSRLEEKIARSLTGGEDDVRRWWNEGDDQTERPFHPISSDGLAIYLPLDDVDDGEAEAFYPDGTRKSVAIESAVPADDHPHGARGVRFPEEKGFSAPLEAPFRPDSEVTISYWVRTPDEVQNQTILAMIGPEDEEADRKKTGWDILGHVRGGFRFHVYDAEGEKIENLMPGETPLRRRAWQHVAIRYSGGMSDSSMTFHVDGERRHGGYGNDNLSESPRFGDHLPSELQLGRSAATGGISDVRIYSRHLAEDEIALLADEFELRELLSERPDFDSLSEEQRERVTRLYHYREDGKTVDLAHALAATDGRRDYLRARNPSSQITLERSSPAMTHVLIRGEYDNHGEKVSASTPAVLPPLKAEGHADRLDLARWLTKPEHPTTARVTVNRIWQSFFGAGIVKTAGDFGIMGEKPTHPELLDYLAVHFRESGWDVKGLIRLITTSATYRQSSRRSPEMLASDPDNRYLSSGPRRRLDAEVIRDQALAVSGILDPTVGGESVKPYQPPGVWKPVAFAGSNTREFKQDPLGKIHRRSVYTFWKRTSIHPALATFDAPTREECSVRRERTNTPLQALVLMNDVQHVEAARVLSETMVREREDESDQEIIEDVFLRVVGRPSTEEDRADLSELLSLARERYAENEEAALALADSGDLPHDESLDPAEVASWTLVIQTLMNRDDVINQS